MRVAPGDVVYVPPGTLHAIGEGVLIVEVQEPEDLSILLEWRDFAIDGAAAGHLGLGFDTALGAVDRRGLSTQEVAALVHRAGDGSPLLPGEAAEYFRLEEIAVDQPATLEPGFAVVVVTGGEVHIGGSALGTGGAVLVPFRAGAVALDGRGTVVVARPPI